METLPHEPEPGLFVRFWHALTRTFFKGLIAIMPIAATVIVLLWLASYLDAPGQRVIDWIERGVGIQEPIVIPGTGLLVGVLVVFIVGILVNAWLVKQMLAASESLLQKVPVAKTVLSSVRDLMGFFNKSGKRPAGQVVLVNFGATGARMIGFVTRQDLSDLPLGPEKGDFVAVYIPYSYAVGGVTVLVPRSSVKLLDMPAEEAMRFAITAGMKRSEKAVGDLVTPPDEAKVSAGAEK